jgi:hypothetical protein
MFKGVMPHTTTQKWPHAAESDAIYSRLHVRPPKYIVTDTDAHGDGWCCESPR